MAWLLCIFSGLILLLLQKKWKKWRRWWVVAIVTALFAASLAATSLGGWLAGLLATLLGMVAGWIGVNGALLAAVAVLVFLPAVIYGFVHDHKADTWEMAGLILLPLLFTVASGPVAAHGGTLTDALSNFGAHGLSYLVGG
ncbi:MAG: hypothetical protein GEV04_24010 [Actinophytocola sp.]|nr:hypothetical protein [Actinophytocola sp.]